jgi:DNA replication ATP-dependent helicase Dna2
MDISLFRRLSDAHPHAVVDLTYQYRMNSDIMLLSNKLIYSDRLVCGSSEVARQTLKLPSKSFLKDMNCKSSCYNSGCWLEKLLDEK